MTRSLARGAALMLAVLPTPLLAQELGDTGRVVEIPEVIVTVARTPLALERIPFPVTIVTPDRADRARPGLALDAALRFVPGLQVDNRYNHALGERISIRGFGARSQFGVRGVRVMVDGLPATLPDGQTSLSHVDPAFVRRVQVIRGPASAIWGNAAGGVILLETMTPDVDEPGTEAGITMGSDGLLRAGVAAMGGNEVGSYAVHASRLGYGGYREFNEAESLRFHARATRRFSAGSARLVAGAVDYDAQNPGSLSRLMMEEDPRQAFPNNLRQRTGEQGSQQHAGLSWRQPAPLGDLELSTYLVRRGIENPIPPVIIDLDRIAGGLNARHDGVIAGPSASTRWTVGVEAERQRDDRRNHRNLEGSRGELRLDQLETVDNLAGFAQLAVSPDYRLTVVAGLRYDHFRFAADDRLVTDTDPDDTGSRTMAALSPSLGVTVPVTPRLSLIASATTAFETPTTTELANRPDGSGGFNPELDPQRARSVEVGARALAGGLRYEIGLYHAAIRDALIPFEHPDLPGRQFFRNAGSATHRGVEASAMADLAPIELRAAYTYTDARFGAYVLDGVDHGGNRVPGVAPHRLAAAATHRASAGWSVTTEGRYSSRAPVDDANENHVSGHLLLDARAAVPVRFAGFTANLLVGVSNLADREHATSVVVNAFGQRFYEPGPGRAWFAGLTLGIPGTRDGR